MVGFSPLSITVFVAIFAVAAAPLMQWVSGPYLVVAALVWGVYFGVARVPPWGQHENVDARAASRRGAMALNLLFFDEGFRSLNAWERQRYTFGSLTTSVLPDETLIYGPVMCIGLAISVAAFRNGLHGLRWSILNRQGRLDSFMGMLFAGCYWLLFLLVVFARGVPDS